MAREKRDTALCFHPDQGFFEKPGRFSQPPQVQRCKKGHLQWGDDSMAVFCSSPPILRATLSAEFSGHL